MNNLTLKLQAAGFANLSRSHFLSASALAAVLIASWLQLSFSVFGLSIFGFFVVLGLAFEGLAIRAKSRSDALVKLWPEVLDSMHSSLSSGYGLVDSLSELAESGPTRIRPIFAELVQRIDSGNSFSEALSWLKTQFGQIQADRVAEVLRITHSAGGAGLLSALRIQSQMTRAEIALLGELESKQGWVTGTAKLAIIAPWIIVATLSSRAENVAIYNTPEGISILAIGLVVSMVAYRLVGKFGQLDLPSRIFTK